MTTSADTGGGGRTYFSRQFVNFDTVLIATLNGAVSNEEYPTSRKCSPYFTCSASGAGRGAEMINNPCFLESQHCV